MMVMFHDIWCMCCVYIRNVQHHIAPAVLKAARKEILVFHIREQHMQTCVVVLKRTVSMRGLFRAPQHMLTRMRLEKKAAENVVCSCRLLHTFAGTID